MAERKGSFRTRDGRYAGRKFSPVTVISMETGEVLRTEKAYRLPELLIARRAGESGQNRKVIEKRRQQAKYTRTRKDRRAAKRAAAVPTAS